MKHGHLFGNHPPRTQSLAEAGACTPAAQGFGAAVATIHETQGIAFHPEHGRLSPSSSESHRLGHGSGRHTPTRLLMAEIRRASDQSEPGPTLPIELGEQPLISLLILGLGAETIPGIAGRHDGKARKPMEIARIDGAAKSGRSVCGIHESPPSSHSTDAIVRHPPKPWPPRFRIPCAGFTRAERTRRPKDRLKRVRTGKHKPTSSSAPRAVMGSPPGAPEDGGG